MKEKVLMLLACLWLGIGFSMAQAPKTDAPIIGSPSSAEVTTPATVLGA